MSAAQAAEPRAFHGWLIVAIEFCGQFITAGTGGYTFGQFIQPLSRSFGWSVGLVSSMNFTRALTSIFVTPLVGRLTDRLGSRPVMVAGTLIAGVAFLLAGLVAGLLNPLNQLVAAIAVPFTGFMYDATGGYSLALAIVSLLALTT